MPVYATMIQVSSSKLLREQASSFSSLAVRQISKGFATMLPGSPMMVIMHLLSETSIPVAFIRNPSISDDR